jgi:integrase/recombinase XerD
MATRKRQTPQQVVRKLTQADRMLAGAESGLMAVAGWWSRQMLDRYTRATASDRAAADW